MDGYKVKGENRRKAQESARRAQPLDNRRSIQLRMAAQAAMLRKDKAKRAGRVVRVYP